MFFAELVSMLIQEEQKRAQAALQEIEAKGGLKRQTKGGKKVRILALSWNLCNTDFSYAFVRLLVGVKFLP
jgi:hypothetical protein